MDNAGAKHNFAVEPDGTIAPISAEEIHRVATEAVENGELVFAVSQVDRGIVFNCFVPPTIELCELLEKMASTIRGIIASQAAMPPTKSE